MTAKTMDTATVTTSGTVHFTCCPTVTQTISISGSRRAPRARQMSHQDAAARVATGEFRTCQSCVKHADDTARALYDTTPQPTPASPASHTPEPRAPKTPSTPEPARVPAAPKPAQSPTTSAGSFAANAAGRFAFMTMISDLIADGDAETALKRIDEEAAALGPRKPKWLSAIEWMRVAREIPDAKASWAALETLTRLNWANI